MFSIYSLSIIVVINICFLLRSILYQVSSSSYNSLKMIEYLCVKSNGHTSAINKYMAFQANMQWCALINWILNLVFDIIIIKMYSVYQIFLCKDRKQANKVIKRVDQLIKYFILFYGILGFLLNYMSYKYLKQVKMSNYNGAE